MLQLFVNVDMNGDIIRVYSGENIIATDPYDFFFLVDQLTIDTLEQHKVVMNGFNAELQLK